MTMQINTSPHNADIHKRKVTKLTLGECQIVLRRLNQNKQLGSKKWFLVARRLWNLRGLPLVTNMQLLQTFAEL